MAHKLGSMGFTNNRIKNECYKTQLNRTTTKIVKKNSFFILTLDKITKIYNLKNVKTGAIVEGITKEFLTDNEMLINGNDYFNKISRELFV